MLATELQSQALQFDMSSNLGEAFLLGLTRIDHSKSLTERTIEIEYLKQVCIEAKNRAVEKGELKGLKEEIESLGEVVQVFKADFRNEYSEFKNRILTSKDLQANGGLYQQTDIILLLSAALNDPDLGRFAAKCLSQLANFSAIASVVFGDPDATSERERGVNKLESNAKIDILAKIVAKNITQGFDCEMPDVSVGSAIAYTRLFPDDRKHAEKIAEIVCKTGSSLHEEDYHEALRSLAGLWPEVVRSELNAKLKIGAVESFRRFDYAHAYFQLFGDDGFLTKRLINIFTKSLRFDREEENAKALECLSKLNRDKVFSYLKRKLNNIDSLDVLEAFAVSYALLKLFPEYSAKVEERINVFEKVIKNYNPSQGRRAIEGLGILGDKSKPVISTILDEYYKRKNSRDICLDSLKKILGSSSKVSELFSPKVSLVINGTDEAALDALIALNEDNIEIINTLIEKLATEGDIFGMTTASALAKFGEKAKGAIPHLIPHLESRHPAVWRSICNALEQIGPDFNCVKPVERIILKTYNKDDHSFRKYAVLVLAKVPPPKDIRKKQILFNILERVIAKEEEDNEIIEIALSKILEITSKGKL